ncbi:hypothetical protein G3I59_05145 [Amycolatopsis rubida]|uniref:DUF892 family protein n=1 Tax=Amycolatopsis rubida TaxID=112413 RepID=A0ABX0BHY7_9PSEU|nr:MULTISPECIES: hypothetical protein [Amycolatopsis]MYW90019.1 hypothetical protein [Amycolatopsis rubida]NEC54996.1 hypothetical protein [Amycolatopsis rubida]OAP29034.1 hypothetical protein A4R44_00828 [Amycolatopsis sp. M39]
MDKETKALIDSLRAVSGHAESIASALMLGKMTPQSQHEYAGMLGELSQLLHEHAAIRETSGHAVRCRPSSPRQNPPALP